MIHCLKNQKFYTIFYYFSSLSEKIDEQKEMISTLTASINPRQNPGYSASMSAKPDFLLFSTVAEIKEYEGTTEQRRNKLVRIM